MKPKMSDIIAVVSSVFEMHHHHLMGPSQEHRIAHPRQAVMFLARELTSLSFPRIGAEMGRDHTTAIHACKRVRERLGTDPSLPAKLDLCRAHIAAVMQQRERNWAAAMAQPVVLEAAE